MPQRTKNASNFMELSHFAAAVCGTLIMEKTMSIEVDTVSPNAATRAPLPPVEKARASSVGAAQAMQSPFEMTDGRSEQAGIGQWVFNHKHSFSADNPLAWYGIRNVLNNMVSIVGLMATIVPVRMGMGHVAKWAETKGMLKTQGVFGNNVLQNSLGVGVSFATFRTMYKMGQRAYDRVFIKPDDASETSQAIHDLPKNWWKDFKQIAPAEYPATMVAGFGLVGIRAAFTPTALDKANHWKDVTACAALAYPVFFEITENLGRTFQLQRGYTTEETNEHINKDKQTLGTFLTRQVPGVAAGIVPYIHFNNIAYRSTGRQASYKIGATAHGIDSFGKAFWKERPYQFFWMFSLGRDLYFDAYDKLFGVPKSAVTTASRKIYKQHEYDNTSATLDADESKGMSQPFSQVHQIASHEKAIGQLHPVTSPTI